MTAHHAQQHLRAIAHAPTAAAHQRFFKTAPGEYGAGDTFVGIKVPPLRAAAKQFRDLRLADLDTLLQSPIHEDRLLALMVLCAQYARGDARHRAQVYRLYLRRRKFINNWDLVDASAPYIVGPHLLDRDVAPLFRLARSRSLWDRRIAIVATQHFIRHHHFAPTLQLAERLLEDPHDLIHKATGWMLRELGKRDEPTLRRFLDIHAGRMPRTMLRYAIERFSPQDRRHYMDVPRRAKCERPIPTTRARPRPTGSRKARIRAVR